MMTPSTLTGFLLIDKQVGWTSQDVATYLRGMVRDTYRQYAVTVNTKHIRIGHAGTLDPFATGLLIMGVGREATKQIDIFKALPKTYVATITLGAVSDTYDGTGSIIQRTVNKEQGSLIDEPREEEITRALQSFTGEQQQIPPMYSAKKVDGKALYKMARQGIEIERKPVSIAIHKIQLISYVYPLLTIEITCSAGTYIRSLAHDIGQYLGTGAYCSELRRTKIGTYSVENAIDVQKLSRDTWPERIFAIEK